MDENQKKKILIVQIVAAILTLLILIVWIINLKNVWKMEKNLAVSDNNQEWADLKNELDQTLASLKSEVEQINQARQKQEDAKNEGLLSNLLTETKKLASTSSSTVVATSSLATSTPITTSTPAHLKRPGCPEYINCMPTIGEARSCQIPVGCEGITVIAY